MHIPYSEGMTSRYTMPERVVKVYRFSTKLNFQRIYFLRKDEKCCVINYNKLVNISGHAATAHVLGRPEYNNIMLKSTTEVKSLTF